MSAPVRFGVLGCSAIAWRRTLPALMSHPLTTLTWVASRDPEKAARFAHEFGARATDYEGLLERDDVDAVYLPLPTGLHRLWGERALQAGKHLLTEKPLASSADDARALVRTAVRHHRLVRENFMFLHHSQHAAVRQLLDAGRLGAVRSLRAAFCIPPLPGSDIRHMPELGGGALLDVGVYPLRTAQLFLGADLRVAGSVLRVDSARGVDVSGQALLVAADGRIASIEFGFEHSYGGHYELWGANARLRLDRAFTPPPTWQPMLRITEQDHAEELTLPADHQFERSVGAFAEAVLAGRTAADADEAGWCDAAIETVRLADDIQRQAIRHSP
jgi:dTDP-3,4-didehydro-2,6-dideoxy-alpha-D-glucose 3-reductase